MSVGIYSLGISGLAAAQAGLVTTGHNITNAGTAGYHRQTIQQSAVTPLATGSGFFGQGVQVESVVRAYSQFLDSQLGQANAQASYYSAYLAQLSQIDNVVADTQAGLSPALQDFFAATQAVAAHPADVPSRQSLLSSGAALTSRFNALAARFDELRSGVNSQLSNTVSEVNSYAQQIAALNGRILLVQQNPNQPPNDLFDQRDLLVAKLNTLVGATVTPQTDGTVNVFIGNGQNLVVGRQAMTLTVAPAADDPQRLQIGYSMGGNTVPLNESSLQSGAVGGLLAFRANELDAAQNALGRIAVGLAQAFNDQQRLGQDLNGALGGNFFTPPAPSVFANSGNTSGAVITASISSAGALTASDYRLAYDGTNYAVTRLSDNTTTTYATLPQTVDGVTIAIASGTPASGDSFLIEPTRNAARALAMNISDPAKIAAAAPIRTAAAGANTGAATLSAGTVNTPPPPNANLQNPVTITFTGPGTFDVSGTGTGNPTGVAYTAGGSITYNGWTVQISGSPAAGDVFTVSSNSGGVADGRNALLLAGLQTSYTLAGGTATFQGAYSQMVSMIGNKTRQIDVTSQAQNTLVDQATQVQQSLSGVNLDEEAANLLRYQQAYQASGKMLQIASSLFQTILDLGG
ncbi:MAG: flagellar hook-associated protein FlgK [Betaproteobacteria bacterium]|nr:flagellar hook-associated protein FlgK [Betaproteobacteria bacterium]